MLSITEVERETGIRPATLRMWERRYGFPQPLRDAHGGRIYPLKQVERLLMARRLMDQGIRPGKIFSGEAKLESSTAARRDVDTEVAPEQFQPILDLLSHYRLAELHGVFQYRLLELGLRRFVIEFLAPLSTAVGLAWGRGQLPVRCEHLYSQLAMSILHANQATVRAAAIGAGPKVVLATPAGEAHVLGILMAEAILASLGAKCIQLGAGVPSFEMAAAAEESAADIVALSFSSYFPRKNAIRLARELRVALAPTATLWLGGNGAADIDTPTAGVQVFGALDDIEPALLRWRAQGVS